MSVENIEAKSLSEPDWLRDELQVWTNSSTQFIVNQRKWTVWHRILLT